VVDLLLNKFFIFGLLAIQTAAPQGVSQSQEVIDRAAREIFETVLSPYCPGRTISNCPSPEADDLRSSIKNELAEGRAPEQVKEELYAVFGDELRTIPRARGFGLLAWLVPGAVFLGGGLAAIRWIRFSRNDEPNSGKTNDPELDSDLEERLKAEMAELESRT